MRMPVALSKKKCNGFYNYPFILFFIRFYMFFLICRPKHRIICMLFAGEGHQGHVTDASNLAALSSLSGHGSNRELSLFL